MAKRSKQKSKLAEVKNSVRQAASVDKLLDTLPLIAPIPTAWAIGAAVDRQLNWPDPVTAIAAIGIETAGFVAADTAAKYYEFNRTAEDGETKAPAWMAYTALGLYVCVTLGMTYLYEPLAMVFPGLSAVGFWLFVLRKDQQARLVSRGADRAAAKAETERVKAERKAEREQKKLAKSQVKPAISQPEPALAEVKPAFVCSCGFEGKSQASLNAHQRKHKQIIGYTVSMEPVTKEQVKQ
jgi:hypothetical protein